MNIIYKGSKCLLWVHLLVKTLLDFFLHVELKTEPVRFDALNLKPFQRTQKHRASLVIIH